MALSPPRPVCVVSNINADKTQTYIQVVVLMPKFQGKNGVKINIRKL
jgi:hypothetical protein